MDETPVERLYECISVSSVCNFDVLQQGWNSGIFGGLRVHSWTERIAELLVVVNYGTQWENPDSESPSQKLKRTT